jgi:type I restriction enzyme R subunit
MPNEADTCRRYVVPKLQAAGWEDEPHRINEQVTFTDGRIIVTGRQGRRRPGKRADYILRFRPDFPIAVVEAKPTYAAPGDGLQQAKDYAEILDLKFANATNGKEIIEFDFLTGIERKIDAFPSPADLWARLRQGRKLPNEKAAEQLLTPCHHQPGKQLRYYQEIAVNRVIEAILMGRTRILLTMATGIVDAASRSPPL